jgi:hypothetical protein
VKAGVLSPFGVQLAMGTNYAGASIMTHVWQRLSAALLIALVAGCASVTTRVLEVKPGAPYPPAAATEILFSAPRRPYSEIAVLESRGELGVSSIDVLEDLRRKAQALGADAVIVTANEGRYQPPVAVYDPWFYDPFFYRQRYLYGPYSPYGDFRVIEGGYYDVAKGIAIRYQDAAKPPPGAAKPPAS